MPPIPLIPILTETALTIYVIVKVIKKICDED
jgi:hypothetical protein